VHVLEAVIWTLLHTKNFATAVMTAVNLGNNTNTLGAVTCSLAALLYGQQSIPERWLKALRGREQLERICQDFELHF
jgi:ADP-ribosylglycohydrolase